MHDIPDNSMPKAPKANPLPASLSPDANALDSEAFDFDDVTLAYENTDFDTPDFLPVDEFANQIDPSDDIFQQAASGSVAAIVQVLNQRLADRGVRTRAMVDEGWLQLLCESVRRSALDRDTLITQVRDIFEEIDPAKIRRVQINSRLAREQQLLWLDDIRRQPKQLLWSEPIHLRRSNPLRRLWKLRHRNDQRRALPIARSRPSLPGRRSSGVGRGIAIGVILALLAGFAYRQWSPSFTDSITPTATPSPVPATTDPFAAAVMIATQAAIDGQTATSASQWLDLSARWQRAAELMEQLPPEDGRYNTAIERATLYRQNSTIAQKRAAQ